jgi:hypothetical protein
MYFLKMMPEHHMLHNGGMFAIEKGVTSPILITLSQH